MSTKKGGGSSANGRDSNPKYLGLKKAGGQPVQPGNIIVRQRGKKFHCKDTHSVGMGKVRAAVQRTPNTSTRELKRPGGRTHAQRAGGGRKQRAAWRAACVILGGRRRLIGSEQQLHHFRSRAARSAGGGRGGERGGGGGGGE